MHTENQFDKLLRKRIEIDPTGIKSKDIMTSLKIIMLGVPDSGKTSLIL